MGLATGFLYNLLLLHWLVHVTGPGMVLLAFVVGAWMVIPFWVWGALASRWYRVPAFALAWAAMEYGRSITPFAFAWGFLGHAAYELDAIRQAVGLVGAIGLSFFIAGLNASITLAFPVAVSLFHSCSFKEAMQRREPTSFRWIAVFAAALAYMQFSGWADLEIERLSSDRVPFRVALIQGNFAQDQKESASTDQMLERYLMLSDDAADESCDLIVWPESTVPYPLNLWDEGLERIVSFSSEHDVELLLGSVHAEFNEDDSIDYANRALHVRPDRISVGDPSPMILRDVDFYDKMHLVPYGEWIPFGEWWPFYYIETFIEEAGAGIFEPGVEQTVFETRSGARFAVMICFESTLSWQARSAKRQGVDFLTVITNDAWFKRSAGLAQHELQSRFRAVEAGSPLIRVANTGITAAYDSNGMPVLAMPDNRMGYLIHTLRLKWRSGLNGEAVEANDNPEQSIRLY